MDIFPAAAQRPEILKFADALGSRDAALRRDECSDWRINGKCGQMYAVPGGYQIVFLGTPRGWSFAKSAMAFAKPTQDGDGEGCLFMDRLPTEAEAAIIRDKIGIPKKREIDEATLARLHAYGDEYRFQKPASTIAPVG